MSKFEQTEALIIDICKKPAGKEDKYVADYIEKLLSCDGINAGHGKDYNGRPYTSIIEDNENVIKLRTEYNLDAKSSRKFIESEIDRENELAVHHPDKTWFLFKDKNENTWTIGNITPKLNPLNKYFEFIGSEVEKVTLLKVVIETYLDIYNKFNISPITLPCGYPSSNMSFPVISKSAIPNRIPILAICNSFSGTR